jgi:hypothetical protein
MAEEATNMNTQLDYIERKGTLTYMIGLDVEIMEGNFQLSLNGRTVEARKNRGRNRYQLCGIDNVISFKETTSDKLIADLDKANDERIARVWGRILEVK